MVVGEPTYLNDDFTLGTEEQVRSAVERAGVEHVDAFLSHIVYNQTVVEHALGVVRPFRVASLREPVSRSWSMFLHGISKNMAAFTLGATTPLEFAKRIRHDFQHTYITGGPLNGIDSIAMVSAHFDHFVLSHRVVESIVTLAVKIGLRADDLLFFSEKTNISTKTWADFVTPAEKKVVDEELVRKTRKDKGLVAMAEKRLNHELAGLDPRVSAIAKDVPLMMKDVKKVCGSILKSGDSCAKFKSIPNGMYLCSAMCIQNWADKHIRCMKVSR